MDLIDRSKVLHDVAALHKFTHNPMVIAMLGRCLRIIESEESGYTGCWVPVTEKLPEVDEIVLVTCEREYDNTVVDITTYSKRGFLIDPVTAWMPLPMPWKGE